MNNRHAVIMAGGAGTRLWPLGRRERPKQFLPLADERSLLRASAERLEGLLPEEQVHIVAGADQRDEAEKAFGVMGDRFIAEPEGRNTAPCIGLACQWLVHRDPSAMVAILPADHWITDEPIFRSTLERAFELARVSGRVADALEGYERAIRAAREHGYVNDEALAHELAARFHQGRGNRVVARAYLVEARYAYERWGAEAKVARLKEDLGESAPDQQPRTSSYTGSSSILDVESVVKTSQAISGEIVFEELLPV